VRVAAVVEHTIDTMRRETTLIAPFERQFAAA
jgi:hypothetical protein